MPKLNKNEGIPLIKTTDKCPTCGKPTPTNPDKIACDREDCPYK